MSNKKIYFTMFFYSITLSNIAYGNVSVLLNLKSSSDEINFPSDGNNESVFATSKSIQVPSKHIFSHVKQTEKHMEVTNNPNNSSGLTEMNTTGNNSYIRITNKQKHVIHSSYTDTKDTTVMWNKLQNDTLIANAIIKYLDTTGNASLADNMSNDKKLPLFATSTTKEVAPETFTENVNEEMIFSTTSRARSLSKVLDDYIYKDIDDQLTDYTYIDDYYTRTPKKVYESKENKKTETSFTNPSDSPFSYAILALEILDLCSGNRKQRNFITVQRLIGLPVEQENYWKGTFDPRPFENLRKVEIVLQVTSSVRVSTDSDFVVTTRLNDTTYIIRGLNTSQVVTFNVQALSGENFPFVKKVTLNGREICKKHRPWRPTLLGPQELAVSSPLVSPHDRGPYFCGRSKIDFTALVVKGLPTKEGDYPWHVAIFINNPEKKNWNYACGGTIISHKTIITAAHCVVNKYGFIIPKERLLIVAGKYWLYEVEENQKPLKIDQIVVHENYTQAENTLAHDLALLITKESIEYGMYVQPICQWNKKQTDREIIFQEFGTMVGWGSTENETLSETLLAASLRVVPDTICFKSRPSFFKRYLTTNTFCAGSENGTSACNGDSGGGLIFPIMEQDGRQSWYLRGVVSAGVRRVGGLCDPTHYVVFTDVVRYSKWIEDHQQL